MELGSLRDQELCEIQSRWPSWALMTPIVRTVSCGCKATLNWDLIAGWTVLLQSCSSAAPSRTLSLWLCSEQLCETAISGVRKLLRTGGVPTSLTLLFWRWLTISSVFTGRSARTSYSHSVSTPTPPPSPFPISPVHNNNNRELIERLRKLKALYNLKKNIQCAKIPVIIQTNGMQAYETYEN